VAPWVPWLAAYEEKVAEIDHQHRELFHMFNELCDAAWEGQGNDSIKEGIKLLARHVVDHSNTEEQYMRRYRFSGYSAHKETHDDFTTDVTNFIEEYENKEISSEVVVSVVIRQGDWIRHHIRSMDWELARFLATSATPDWPSTYRRA
jgi:hemerythrin-like metal-binding protein